MPDKSPKGGTAIFNEDGSVDWVQLNGWQNPEFKDFSIGEPEKKETIKCPDWVPDNLCGGYRSIAAGNGIDMIPIIGTPIAVAKATSAAASKAGDFIADKYKSIIFIVLGAILVFISIVLIFKDSAISQVSKAVRES